MTTVRQLCNALSQLFALNAASFAAPLVRSGWLPRAREEVDAIDAAVLVAGILAAPEPAAVVDAVHTLSGAMADPVFWSPVEPVSWRDYEPEQPLTGQQLDLIPTSPIDFLAEMISGYGPNNVLTLFLVEVGGASVAVAVRVGHVGNWWSVRATYDHGHAKLLPKIRNYRKLPVEAISAIVDILAAADVRPAESFRHEGVTLH